MKPRFQSLSFSLKFANCVDSLKLRFKVFRKRSHRICSNFAIIEAIMAGKNSLKRFLKKTPGEEKHKDK